MALQKAGARPRRGPTCHGRAARASPPWPDALALPDDDPVRYFLNHEAHSGLPKWPSASHYLQTCSIPADVHDYCHVIDPSHASSIPSYPSDPRANRSRAPSTDSFDTRASSPPGSLLSPVQTDRSDAMASVRHPSRGPSPLGRTSLHPEQGHQAPLLCLGPQCDQKFKSEQELRTHVETIHKHSCSWAGCDQASFPSRDRLVWHVNVEHLLVCPVSGCKEASSFESARMLRSHIAVAHPEAGSGHVKEWMLTPSVSIEPATSPRMKNTVPKEMERPTAKAVKYKSRGETDLVKLTKRKCQDQLRSAVEKKVKKTAGTPKAADSPTDLIRNRATKFIEAASFPLVFEHALLPFLAELMPKWAGPGHVISVVRGRTPQTRRICIMTKKGISRARKIMIAGHVVDLLPETYRNTVTFVFSVGKVERMVWARGLGKSLPDDICAARNPYYFHVPCMGDSVGIPALGDCRESTATLGPCLVIGGASYWLSNFHPFLEAYQSHGSIHIEHPSPQDRFRCMEEAHDALNPDEDFRIGDLEVTSGLNLKTTRISHDPYWEDCGKDPPLVVMDWALTSADASRANMLRRFPSETQPVLEEPLVRSASAIIPGASIISSGRTSGHQRGQICEVPAYVSGEENGTQKATREWYVEEGYPFENEEAWIRGGIGVEGDSGAAVVDADTNSLVGQLWGRNAYWGPGPRITYFTPIADIFDDIQEKCGQQTRPQLPQHRDESERYAAYPSCRQCYDLRTYLDSRRSSRLSLESMIMGKGDVEQDLTLTEEGVSELATPRDFPRYMGIEETGSSFNNILDHLHMAPYTPGSLGIPEVKSPYATTLLPEDLYEAESSARDDHASKRPAPWSMASTMFAVDSSTQRAKRHKRGE
ncbi:hypothetical protein S7711_04309 [Stachybotrys chartarum IBT 7711]|uniref:C2H2-type domain-containing protein n=1 Tax=Stachybotrys chartarum (strain CBS 109288 / IBT 7711) TaxID=1280523 RepID=A0A084AJD2_STACB|nr:hypothetical protein S7711_04309 [Stachybotrys chartarum IBT 7711]